MRIEGSNKSTKKNLYIYCDHTRPIVWTFIVNVLRYFFCLFRFMRKTFLSCCQYNSDKIRNWQKRGGWQRRWNVEYDDDEKKCSLCCENNSSICVLFHLAQFDFINPDILDLKVFFSLLFSCFSPSQHTNNELLYWFYENDTYTIVQLLVVVYTVLNVMKREVFFFCSGKLVKQKPLKCFDHEKKKIFSNAQCWWWWWKTFNADSIHS